MRRINVRCPGAVKCPAEIIEEVMHMIAFGKKEKLCADWWNNQFRTFFPNTSIRNLVLLL